MPLCQSPYRPYNLKENQIIFRSQVHGKSTAKSPFLVIITYLLSLRSARPSKSRHLTYVRTYVRATFICNGNGYIIQIESFNIIKIDR